MPSVRVVAERLKELGAADLDHPGGTLLRHLHGAHDSLEQLGAPVAHRLAALCHAAYGTNGFDRALLDPSDRAPLRDLVGQEAEQLVWLYCRSDQDRFTRTAADDHQFIPDRHNGTLISVTPAEFAGLPSVWLGNELDLLEHADPSWVLDGGSDVWAMLRLNEKHLVDGATEALDQAIGIARSNAA